MKLPAAATLNLARVWGAGMNPEVLLAAKLAWLLLVCSGFLVRAGRPGAALLEGAGVTALLPGWLVPGAFLLAGAALLMNQFVRAAAVAAGACVVLTTLGSLAAWRSHEWICGAVLVLAGLDQPGARPWLMRAQVTLALLSTLVDGTGAMDWVSRATLEGWQVERDTPSLLLALRPLLPSAVLHALSTWVVPGTAAVVASAMWIPRVRARALWWACAWLAAGSVLVANDEAFFFSASVLVAMLSWLDWPRVSLRAHWPRACGWPMWLRIALDHYDFDRRTEWPFPDNPDADLDVWVDGRHLVQRDGIVALLLYFPLFHMGILAVTVALQLALPQPWSSVAQGSIALWLLGFFALPTFERLRRRIA